MGYDDDGNEDEVERARGAAVEAAMPWMMLLGMGLLVLVLIAWLRL